MDASEARISDHKLNTILMPPRFRSAVRIECRAKVGSTPSRGDTGAPGAVRTRTMQANTYVNTSVH